jgi:hypothetical protein
MRTVILAALAAFALTPALSAAPARAADAAPVDAATRAKVRQVFEAAGLIGTWGVDCNAPASSTEWEIITIEPDGSVQTAMGGDDELDVFDIVDARRLNSRDIWMKVIDTEDGDAMTFVYRVEANRQMTWSSINAEGRRLITRGRFANGQDQSSWYNRCPAGVPGPGPRPAADAPTGPDPANDLRKAPKEPAR